jgi:hypothetical protein
MPVILRISKLYKRIFSFTKSGLINEINVLADAASVTPTPEPPDGNPLLEAAGISYNHTEISSNSNRSPKNFPLQSL